MAISTAVDPSAVARVLGIKTQFRNLQGGNVTVLPMRIAVVGQGATASTYATTKAQVFSATEAGNTYGFGSPVHLACEQLLPASGDGVGIIPVTVYPMEDNGSGVAAAGDITPTVGSIVQANYQVSINNILSEYFTVEVGDVVADVVDKMVVAVNAVSRMPMIASDGTTKLDLTSKWKGASANDLQIEVIGSTTSGMTWAYTQPTGGSANPTVDASLAQFGNVWETMVMNCLDVADTTALAKYAEVNEGRWGALVRKPFIAFSGDTNTTVASAIAVPDARKTDRTNCQLVAPGSKDLPFVVAARQLAEIAKVANSNPPHDYGSQQATGLTPGADGDQWDAAQRDTAVKAGSSTIQVKDDVINISDVVTFYHPTGDDTPAYRYVVDVIKVMNILFNTDIRFSLPEWDGAPLIPDDQATVNPTAKKPKMAKAVIADMIDGLALETIISDPDVAKETIQAAISSSNPKRLDLAYTVQLSGNTNIISIDFNFGFYFGTAPVVG